MLLSNTWPAIGDRERPPAASRDGRLFQHHKSRVLHLGRLRHADVLACGRPLSTAFLSLPDWPAMPWPKCLQCFGSEHYAT